MTTIEKTLSPARFLIMTDLCLSVEDVVGMSSADVAWYAGECVELRKLSRRLKVEAQRKV